MSINIRELDGGNDVFVNLSSLNSGQLDVDPNLQADIVTYIKGRIASIPGASTIRATETVEVTTVI